MTFLFLNVLRGGGGSTGLGNIPNFFETFLNSNTRRKQHNEDDGENTAEKQGGDREASIITTRSAV